MKKTILSMLALVFVVSMCCVFASCKTINTVTKYNVTFDSNGGSEVQTQSVKKGETATEPTAPEKDGFTFVEWQLDGQAYDFATSVDEDITLVAQWEEKPAPKAASYTVEHYLQNTNDDEYTI